MAKGVSRKIKEYLSCMLYFCEKEAGGEGGGGSRAAEWFEYAQNRKTYSIQYLVKLFFLMWRDVGDSAWLPYSY